MKVYLSDDTAIQTSATSDPVAADIMNKGKVVIYAMLALIALIYLPAITRQARRIAR